MVPRELQAELLAAAAEYPVVTLLGPRQSGKTTLTRMAFPRREYRSMEDPDVRMAALTDPRGFLSGLPDGAILDEIQRTPELLSYVQGRIDQRRKTGEFILTGSHQPALHAAASQSLAGRTAVLTLLPFSVSELRYYRKTWDPFDLAVRGCFPRLHEERLSQRRFFNGYVQTYLERDVRMLSNLKDLTLFQHFLTLIAGRVGQVVNYTSLANDLGVSSTTVRSWVSVLTASFVLFELPPYFENISKRVVRSPKLYFTDPGLVAHLVGIDTAGQASRDPMRGALYENLVIVEVLKQRLNAGLLPSLFFYRDTNGNEVDLVVKDGRNLVPVEIKSAATFTADFLKGLERFRAAAGSRASGGFLLYNGKERFNVKGVSVLNPLLQRDIRNVAGLAGK
jgi:predicted AAA+ superfamily ATPase